MDDMDIKEFFLVYFILGVCDYIKIKIEIVFFIGVMDEFIVEKIKFGWIIILLGKEVDLFLMFLI